jgi:predicted acetyltransferase
MSLEQANEKAAGVSLPNFHDAELTLRLTSIEPHQFLQAPTYYFTMVDSESGESLGRINLRAASDFNMFIYSGHIGCNVDEKHQGNRFAARSVLLLLPFAAQIGLDPLWITCNPDNIASRRTCEIAGGELVEIVDVPEDTAIYRAGAHQKCRYRFRIST